MSESKFRAAVIGLGRMGSTFDDEIEQGGQFFMPYCHAPTYTASPRTDLIAGADPHAAVARAHRMARRKLGSSGPDAFRDSLAAGQSSRPSPALRTRP